LSFLFEVLKSQIGVFSFQGDVKMDLQTITVVIAGISVIIGVTNSILSSRRAEKNDERTLETRQAQLYMQVYNRWNSKEMVHAYGQVRFKYQWTDFNDVWTKYGPDANPEAYSNLMLLRTFFEGLGILVKKKLIDVALIEDLLSARVVWYWEKALGPVIREIRKMTNDPTQADHIEYLYHELKRRQQATTISS
jgi:hypothetical protein